MRVALAQFDAVVGDLGANAKRIKDIYNEAVEQKADLVVFPELSLCGYPPEDLLFKKHFVNENARILKELAAEFKQAAVILGFPDTDGDDCYNAAAVISNGQVQNVYHKGLLPNYGVFDEARYFQPGDEPVMVEVQGIRIAITICRDIWEIDWLDEFVKPLGRFDMICNISASPYHMGKKGQRKKVIERCAKNFHAAVCYCNLVGGQDELVFDGRSMIFDADGTLVAQALDFERDIVFADINRDADRRITASPVFGSALPPRHELDSVYKALVLGTRDYTRKNGFSKALIGLSGGIDSSLVACIAAEALGPENVIGITMPSRFNSQQTKDDARILAENLGTQFHTIPIEPILAAFDQSLGLVNGWDNKGLAYENLQARVRGTLLMSLSNQFGALVLTTGNKSETAVGYSTLYGDTAGGFAVIKDVPKTLVYKLSSYINEKAGREIIPVDVITRPPSAELREDQKDSDSLPDYDLLDTILQGYVEHDYSAQQLVDRGLDRETVRRVIKMVDRNEYKRRQSPPGIKITPKAFGRDRRLPITNRFDSTAI